MDVFRFGFGIPAEPDVGPAGLEIFRIGAGRDFPVFVLFREPDFHIVAFGGRKAQIPGAQADHMVGQFQGFQDVFRVAHQFFQFIIAGFRFAELHHFHFVELVLPDQAPGIPACAAGFGPEAGGHGSQVDGQVIPVQDFSPVIVGQRHFRGGDQVHILAFHLVHVFVEFGQLPGTGHGSGVHDVGRDHFQIAVFPGVLVQHEVVHRTFQTGAGPFVIVEPGTGNLGCPFRIQDPQFFPDFPMGFRFEIKVGGFAPFPHFRIFRIVLAHRHIRCRHIGDGQHHSLEPGFHILHFFIRFCDLVTQGPHGGDFFRCVFPIALHPADFSAHRIPLALVRFHFLEQGTPFLVQLLEFFQIHFGMTVFQSLGNLFRVVPDKFQIQHDYNPQKFNAILLSL